jgi:hypothetical protein
MSWKCTICGIEHPDAPPSFGIEAPWRAFVPEVEFSRRVELSADQCVVDGKTFFIRGIIQIPVRNSSQTLDFSVWSSLGEQSFRHMCDRWECCDREYDPPYFGWLCSPINVYPNTVHLKLSVQPRRPGLAPLFTVEPTAHPLAIDQREGITPARLNEIAHRLLHV